MKIKSITIFKTVLTLFAIVVWISNQLLTFFSSAPNLVIIVIISDLLSILSKTDCNLIEVYESSLTETLLFGKSLFELEKNFLIINASIDYIYCKQMREKVLKYFLTQN